MTDESDIDMPFGGGKPPSKKFTKRAVPKSPTEELLKEAADKTKKITTKIMVTKALVDLDTRKGVSVYAIKKYLEDNFEVNTEKISYFIKKSIKNGVEKGAIKQIKGTGASGSFRLAPKSKEEKKKKKVKSKPKTKEGEEGNDKKANKKKKKPMEKSTKTKKVTVKEPKLKDKTDKAKKADPTESKKSDKGKKPKAAKKTESVKTPAKKRAIMLKRKSLGSIRKPPKMKPKSIKAK